MAGPLLYRPQPRWQVIAAFGGALALHFAAVGIASIKPAEHIEDLSQIPEAVVELSLEAQKEPRNLRRPRRKSRHRRRRQRPCRKKSLSMSRKRRPLLPRDRLRRNRSSRSRGPSRPVPLDPAPSGKAAMIFKPRIQYPYEARRSKITGSGTIVVSVGPDGSVTSCSMGASTGSPILDNAATSAFRSARFKPGTVPRVKIPITFTLTGASY